MDAAALTRLTAGLTIEAVHTAPDRVEIHLSSGVTFVVEDSGDGLVASVRRAPAAKRTSRAKDQPTPRQLEYLHFIARFMARFGGSPAESDIQRHFLVSAPSVNQMIRTLEQRGFITRGRDFFTGQAAARSIRILIDLK